MKLLSSLVTFLLVFVGTASAQNSTRLQCAAQTVVLQLNNGLVAATSAYYAAIVAQTQMCISTALSSCDLDFDVEEIAVTNNCTAAGGMVYTPSVSFQCDDSNSNASTTWVEEYEFCIASSCTNTVDVEAQINRLLANATAAVNVLLNRNGIECSGQVSSDANRMSFSGWVAALVGVMSGVTFAATLF
jgi:hypothetical protein